MTVLRSTMTMSSIQGMTKNNPGPTAPPFLIFPSLKMTALSYSCEDLNYYNLYMTNDEFTLTCFTMKNMEIGMVIATKIIDTTMRKVVIQL